MYKKIIKGILYVLEMLILIFCGIAVEMYYGNCYLGRGIECYLILSTLIIIGEIADLW